MAKRQPSKAKPETKPQPKTPAELLKELPEDALASGVDVAILDAFIILKQLDPELEFEKFFNKCFSGMGDKGVRIVFPSIVVSDFQVDVDAQCAAYVECVDLMADPQFDPATLSEILGGLITEKGGLPLGDDSAEDQTPVRDEPEPDPAPSSKGKKGGKDEKDDTEPAPSGKGKKGGKKNTEEGVEPAADGKSEKKAPRARTTPEEDAEFEQPPQELEPADLEVSIPAATLEIAEDVLGKPSREKEGTIIKHVSVTIDDKAKVVLAITANPDRTYLDAYIASRDDKKSILAEASGMYYDIIGRFEFEFRGKKFVVETFPPDKE